MAALTKAGVSNEGKPSIIVKNNYSYVGKVRPKTSIYWRWSKRLKKKQRSLTSRGTDQGFC